VSLDGSEAERATSSAEAPLGLRLLRSDGAKILRSPEPGVPESRSPGDVGTATRMFWQPEWPPRPSAHSIRFISAPAAPTMRSSSIVLLLLASLGAVIAHPFTDCRFVRSRPTVPDSAHHHSQSLHPPSPPFTRPSRALSRVCPCNKVSVLTLLLLLLPHIPFAHKTAPRARAMSSK
jgi:hypothetical protein